jgi:hypothetical protein
MKEPVNPFAVTAGAFVGALPCWAGVAIMILIFYKHSANDGA